MTLQNTLTLEAFKAIPKHSVMKLIPATIKRRLEDVFNVEK